MMAIVPLLLALALLVFPTASTRGRLARITSDVPTPPVRAGPTGGRARADPLLLAAGWDLLSVGMRGGIPLPVLVRAVAEEIHGPAARALREVADLLALGTDPVAAWEPALRHPDTAELARAARRTARAGSGLAAVADNAAAEVRAAANAAADARAQRAGVWVAAPLGLCFLPGFICLGVLPVIAGMVRQLAMNF